MDAMPTSSDIIMEVIRFIASVMDSTVSYTHLDVYKRQLLTLC